MAGSQSVWGSGLHVWHGSLRPCLARCAGPALVLDARCGELADGAQLCGNGRAVGGSVVQHWQVDADVTRHRGGRRQRIGTDGGADAEEVFCKRGALRTRRSFC